MVYSGLVSVTFRHLNPEEIIALARMAGLHGIEWSGDKHVPHGDVECAEKVLKLTENAGLKVAAYGSYYRVGEQNDFTFDQVLKTAIALKAPVIRIWAGQRGSSEASEMFWNNVVEETINIANAARAENIRIAFEFHNNTLTDTNESCLKLLKKTDQGYVSAYWQPSQNMNINERLYGLKAILPWLSHIHVYHWENKQRRPLYEGLNEWVRYMSVIQQADADRYAMLEFVKDNSIENFFQDAKILKRLLANRQI